MTNHSRVVVIGGGIMGVSALYHLAKEGWSDAVLLEKAELTSGSTWHAAGQVSHSVSHLGLAIMNGYATSLYPKLEELTGQSATWHGCGSLRVAYTREEVDWLHYTRCVGRGLGFPMDVIGPAEIKALHPFYNTKGIRAALHTPADGHVDPAGATLALAKGARDAGAQIVRHNRVTDVQSLPSGEWRVVSEQGDYVCEHVVNAGGTYARQIGAWMGLDLPIVNMTHHYLVTDTVPEFADLEQELPVVRDDREVSGYIRMEQRSGLIGIYEKSNPNTVWNDGTPWAAEHELFEPDFERLSPWLENAFERMPVLAELGIKRTVHGAITHPPDGNMLLGPAPSLTNAWCCCGSQIGLAWGPGAGKYLAQWMVHGAADINMRDFDPRRFGSFADRRYQLIKSPEDYLLRHETPFPGLNRPAGRPVKPSSLYQRLKQHGAVFEEVFGWERPRWFARAGRPPVDCYSFRRAAWHDEVASETHTVRNHVGIMDISAFAKVEVRGRGAATFVSRMIANRLPSKPGAMVLTHLLSAIGRIELEATVVRTHQESYYFVCAAFFETRLVDWLTRHLDPDEGITIVNLSSSHGALALQGPKSRQVLSEVACASLANEDFPWLTLRDIDVANCPVRAIRVSYTGELGWELHTPMHNLPKVYDALWSAGAPHGMDNYGSFAMNAMRMEKAFKGAGELTNEVTLPEADVLRFVALDKPEFIGRAATLRSSEEELRWKCAYLQIDVDDIDCWGAETVWHNGVRVGALSSYAYGHSVGTGLAFAYLSADASQAGTRLEVSVLDGTRPAVVLDRPAYDPLNVRPRA